MKSRRQAVFGVCAALLLAASASRASAQIIYEPVQFQYGGANGFYYGGHDPAVIAAAALPIGGSMPRLNHTPLRIYTDLMPPGENARIYGFTIADARNEANANAARYFRQADVFAAKRNVINEMVVPAWAGADPTQSAPPAPASVTITPSGPHPLMVIPIPPQMQQSSKTQLLVGRPVSSQPAPAQAAVAVRAAGAAAVGVSALAS